MQRIKGVAPAALVATSWLLNAATAHASLSADVMALSQQCAPSVHPTTMAYIVRHESANNPFAIGINDGPRLSVQPSDKATAVALAEELLADGRSFDSGYGQIHSGNLPGLGLSIADLFDPCENLRAAAVILSGCFERASAANGISSNLRDSDQTALLAALSCYNTNSLTRGFDNGYVGKVTGQVDVAYAVPELLPSNTQQAPPVRLQPVQDNQAEQLPTAGGDVFDSARGGAFAPKEQKNQVAAATDDTTESVTTFYEAVEVTSERD
ncbi:lytic transglycosylase domain-containing protein [Marinobacter sp.]|uniref:lytic transglycosylase domain-containing protein n=1 Tax=Marinobacter sp. TaxID=50741 RepID=UPI003A93B3B0